MGKPQKNQKGFLSIELSFLLPFVLFTLLAGIEGLRIVGGQISMGYALMQVVSEVRFTPGQDLQNIQQNVRQRIGEVGLVSASDVVVTVQALPNEAVVGMQNSNRLQLIKLEYPFNIFSFLPLPNSLKNYTWTRSVLFQEEV